MLEKEEKEEDEVEVEERRGGEGERGVAKLSLLLTPPLLLPAMCVHNYSSYVMMSLTVIRYCIYTVIKINGLPTLVICLLLPTYHNSFREGMGGMV